MTAASKKQRRSSRAWVQTHRRRGRGSVASAKARENGRVLDPGVSHAAGTMAVLSVLFALRGRNLKGSA